MTPTTTVSKPKSTRKTARRKNNKASSKTQSTKRQTKQRSTSKTPSQTAEIPKQKIVRPKLWEQYLEVRKQSLEICSPLHPEDYVVQPALDVSPPKWHLGHTTWFFENFILNDHSKNYTLFDEQLNWFFNSYYESQGPRILRSNRGNMTRPTLETVFQYRQFIDEKMVAFLKGFRRVPKKIADLLIVGLHHEQQHQELLVTDIKYILGNNPIYPAYHDNEDFRKTRNRPGKPRFLKFEEGLYEVGYAGKDFHWDNEGKAHKVYLEKFQLMDRLVTNGEYMKFIEAGGYEQFEHWLGEGWDWVKSLEEKAPLYWHKQGNVWYHYTLEGLQRVNPDLPVTHISYYEADAFAQWKGMRLPTEFEWEVACKSLYKDIPMNGNFLESGHFHPTEQANRKDAQMLGHAWEWTGSAYLPYPNYPRFKGALGEYNGKFMINQMVLRGGSCATPHSHMRITYRNFFHADKRWQFTGFRLAK